MRIHTPFELRSIPFHPWYLNKMSCDFLEHQSVWRFFYNVKTMTQFYSHFTCEGAKVAVLLRRHREVGPLTVRADGVRARRVLDTRAVDVPADVGTETDKLQLH